MTMLDITSGEPLNYPDDSFVVARLREENRCQSAVIAGYREKNAALEGMVRGLQSENDRLNKENRSLQAENKKLRASPPSSSSHKVNETDSEKEGR
jgi:hypothetical protein